MSKDQVIGGLILVGSVVGIFLYGWLIFFVSPQLILQLTALAAVVGILGILAWIGYTLATTPPPTPIEDIEKELELDLKKEEEEAKAAKQEPSKQAEKEE